MGGRGSSSGGGGKASKLKGLQIDLNYALMKAHEFGNAPYGGTKKTRELFYEWNDEARRLREEILKLERKK